MMVVSNNNFKYGCDAVAADDDNEDDDDDDDDVVVVDDDDYDDDDDDEKLGRAHLQFKFLENDEIENKN
jgi:hypothetical protein